MKTETGKDKIMLDKYFVRAYARRVGLLSDTKIAEKMMFCDGEIPLEGCRKTLEYWFNNGFEEHRASALAEILQTSVENLKG